MDKIDLAYTAGLFDGEGSVGISKQTERKCKTGYYYRLWVSMSNTDQEIIYWLEKHFGGSAIQRKVNGDRYKNQYQWALAPKNAINFLKLISPYVRIKKQQIELCIQFPTTIGWERDEKGRNKGKSIEILLKQEEIYQKMKLLNKRGLVQ